MIRAARPQRGVARTTRAVVTAAAAVFALSLSCASNSGRAGTARRAETGPSDGAPGESFTELTSDGAWCWFADPRAVTVARPRERTYVGWVDSDGRVWVASVERDGVVRSAVLADFAHPDDHANPALLVRPDGHIVAFYSDHGGDEMFYRVSARTGDVVGWGEPLSLSPGDEDGGYGFTYPNPFVLSSEEDRTYLFYRGRRRRPAYVTTDDFVSWSDETMLLGDEVGDSYVKYASDGRRTIHLAFTDGHPRGRPRNSVYYARYADGAFERADGSVICSVDELPISPAEADLVYDARQSGARAWVWDIAADEDGHPVIAYVVFPRDSEHRYRYARWDGRAWSDSEIAFSGGWFPNTPEDMPEAEVYYSGGLALDQYDPSTVYISRRVHGVFEIERWTTSDRGRTWRSRAVTSESSENNVRPVVARGHAPGEPQLFWMSGRYVSYRDYATALRTASAPG